MSTDFRALCAELLEHTRHHRRDEGPHLVTP